MGAHEGIYAECVWGQASTHTMSISIEEPEASKFMEEEVWKENNVTMVTAKWLVVLKINWSTGGKYDAFIWEHFYGYSPIATCFREDQKEIVDFRCQLPEEVQILQHNGNMIQQSKHDQHHQLTSILKLLL